MLATTLCKGTISKYNSFDDDSEKLSSSIASLEEELQTLISENGEFLRYSNPVMMLIKPNATEDILVESVSDDQRLLEIAEIVDNIHSSDIIVHEIRLWSDVQKINSVDKCVLLHIFDTEDVCINSIRMLNFLGSLLQKYSSIKLIKPGISCPTEISYYIVLMNEESAKECSACNTAGMYIDFLYAIYEYAIYIMNVVVNMNYDLKYDDVLDRKCDYGNMYKQFIARLNRIIETLRKNVSSETIIETE